MGTYLQSKTEPIINKNDYGYAFSVKLLYKWLQSVDLELYLLNPVKQKYMDLFKEHTLINQTEIGKHQILTYTYIGTSIKSIQPKWSTSFHLQSLKPPYLKKEHIQNLRPMKKNSFADRRSHWAPASYKSGRDFPK